MVLHVAYFASKALAFIASFPALYLWESQYSKGPKPQASLYTVEHAGGEVSAFRSDVYPHLPGQSSEAYKGRVAMLPTCIPSNPRYQCSHNVGAYQHSYCRHSTQFWSPPFQPAKLSDNGCKPLRSLSCAAYQNKTRSKMYSGSSLGPQCPLGLFRTLRVLLDQIKRRT